MAKAHMDPWGKMTEWFQVVTNNVEAIPQATFKTDHKHAKDRFSLLSKLLEALDKKYATNTGTEEVLTPMELLLVDVCLDFDHIYWEQRRRREEALPHASRARPEDVDDAEFVAVLLRRD